jgi:hypothetical protein
MLVYSVLSVSNNLFHLCSQSYFPLLLERKELTMTPSFPIVWQHSRTLAALGVATVAGTLFIGGVAPANAEESAPSAVAGDVSATSLYNGYFIENHSAATLTLKSESTPNGWGAEPQKVILPGETVYFEVTYWLGWQDDSTLVYDTSAGDTVTFYANVFFNPLSRSTLKFSDLSEFNAVWGAGEVVKSHGRTDQTVFRYFG